MAVTRRRSKLWWRISHQSKALDVSYPSSPSKRDLKHSGTFFKNLHATLNSQLMKYFAQKCQKNVSWYFFGFDICNLKLFPIKNRSSIVPSLQNIKNIQLLTKLISKQCHFWKNGENQFWPVLQYVKKYAELNGDIRFGWNLLKWHVFDDFHFLHFL